jgi:hypothetical protein
MFSLKLKQTAVSYMGVEIVAGAEYAETVLIITYPVPDDWQAKRPSSFPGARRFAGSVSSPFLLRLTPDNYFASGGTSERD